MRELKDAGLATAHGSMADQVTRILMTQFGQIFLQPLVGRTFEHFGETGVPRLTVRVGDEPA